MVDANDGIVYPMRRANRPAEETAEEMTEVTDKQRQEAMLRRIDEDTRRRVAAGTACERHPAFDADNCPGCGTSARIGG